MTGFQIGLLAYISLSAIFTVAMIGHERRPTTPGVAAASLIVMMLFAIAVIVYGG